MPFTICVTFPFPMSFVITLITSCTFIIMVIFLHAYLDSLNRWYSALLLKVVHEAAAPGFINMLLIRGFLQN